MSTGQTHCNSCGGKLAEDELTAKVPQGGALVCKKCRRATTAAQRGPWKPVMAWDAYDGFRLASTAPIPWKDANVAMLWISGDGVARTAHTLTGKRAMLTDAGTADLLLAAWPGSRRQNVFIINNRAEVRQALG
jgi:hypothetical protein